jgi:hypothetical protein
MKDFIPLNVQACSAHSSLNRRTHANENNWQKYIATNYLVNIWLHYNDSSKAAIRSLCMFMSICPAIWGGKKRNYVHSQLHKWDKKSFDLTLIFSYIYIYSQMKK